MSIVFSKPRINGLVPRNRIMRSATYEALATEDGLCTEKLTKLYTRLARGGVGLIVSGCCYVNKQGRGDKFQVGISNEEQVSSIH